MSKKELKDTPTELDPGQRAFVDAYFANNMNGTRAYLDTHPKAQYNTARAEAPRVLANPSIRAEISRRLDEMAMPANEAIARMAAIARAAFLPFVRIDDDGFVYFNFADPEAKAYMHIIKKIKSKRERRIDGQGDNAQEWEGEWVEVELYDAKAALDTILKMHGKLTEHIDLTTQGEKIKGYLIVSPDDWDKKSNAAK